MKIAITGATGHVGVNMVRGILEKGYEVRAIFRSPSKKIALHNLEIEERVGDILDIEFLKRAFEDIDVVIHLAAKISLSGDPDGSVFKTNVEGTKNVVEACAHCGVMKLVHFSSIEAFKIKLPIPVIDENSPRADGTSFKYGHSKYLGELEALKGLEHGMDVVIFHPTGVMGGHDYFESHAGKFLSDLMNNKLPAIVQSGFDWVDVRDLIETTEKSFSRKDNGENYILSGNWASAKEVAEICKKVAGNKVPLLNLPIWVALLFLPFSMVFDKITGQKPVFTYESLMILKNGEKQFSHEKAKRDFGYSPRGLEETIQSVYEWFLKNGKIK